DYHCAAWDNSLRSVLF
nr:immunoglobulin light chain junction region [Macaca mulatta]MOV94325.1 immunoglobulin light chain junction region [Macaca mulatta]MOV94331.1 immunoglobulin light chain junction region [Macaca mulatta]MOV94424.1 immunoglobulin light chain junction region [Macaca mulatta]MOV94467.1 immunoglobulin light chain junction region [Macaca mulatta]